MKIVDININSYGNIENKDVELKDGINIIKGSNESGKSTLLSYISNIFYGISKNKDGKSISDFEKFKPWNGSDFSGKIRYKLDNEEIYEVYRDFTKKNPKIFNDKMEDISNEFDVDKKDGNKFFVEQTGLDKQMYLSTVVSMQQEVRLDEKNQNILVQKIANLAGTGEDNVSYKKAFTKLQDKIRDEIGTNKTTQKPINITQNRLYEVEKELEKIRPFEDKKYSIDNEKNIVTEEIAKKEKQYEIAKELKKIELDVETARKAIGLNEKSKRENVEQIEKLHKEKEKNEVESKGIEEKISKLEKKKFKGFYIPFAIIIVLLLVLVVVNIVAIKKQIISIMAIAGIIVDILICVIINGSRKKKSKEAINKEIEKYRQQIYTIQNNIAMISGKIDVLENNNKSIEEDIKSSEEKMNLDLKRKKEEIKYHSEMNDYELDNILKEDLEAELTDSKIKLKGLEIEEKNILPQLDSIVELEEKKDLLKQEYADLKDKEEIINIAIESLTEAYEEMKTSITPKFTTNLSETVARITDGKYNKITISDTNGMIMENEKGDYIDLDRLSTGTIDELYLSLRLSMIDDIAKEKMPIILDESFAYFDDERLSNILEYLANELKGHQIIILTCTNREKDVLDNLKIKYNLITM